MASEWSQDIYINAYRFAAEAHWNRKKKQVVPGTDIPYLMHFSLVAMEVIAALEKNPIWKATLPSSAHCSTTR